ncbi:MAG: Ig-like domain repeat protein [Actinomycetes bacterium]
MRQRQRWSSTACGAAPRCARTAPRARGARLALTALGVLLTGLVLGLLATPAAASDGPVFTSTPPDVTSSTSLSWSGTLPADATADCELTSPSGTSVAACGAAGTFTFSTTASVDGTWTLDVYAVTVDALTGATVRSAPTTDSVVVDTTAPSVTITGSPTSPSSDTSPTWTFTLSEGTATCRVTGPGYDSGAVGCAGSYTADLSSGSEGSYVLTVMATDAAGNSGGATSSGYDLVLPPATPTVTGPTSPGTATTVGWTFTVPTGATASCTLTGPTGTTVASDAACTSPWSTGLTDGEGTYTAAVVLTDSGGSSAPGTASYVLDLTAPTAPVVDGPSGRTNDSTPTWTFDAAGATALCRLEQDGVVGAEGPCSSPWTVTVADGTYRLFVVLVDAAGNRSGDGVSAAVEVDTTGPAAPAVTGAPASPNNGGASASFTWNHALTGTTTSCRVLHGGAVVQDWALCTGTVTVGIAALSDGVVTLELRSADDLGNLSAVTTSAVTLDRTAPAAPSVSTPAGPSSTSSLPVTFSGETGATATCTLLRDGTVLETVAGCLSGHAFDLSSRPDGTYTVQVVLTDVAGNTGAAGSDSYVYDTTAPGAPVFTAEPATSSSATPVWEFTADGSTTCTLTAPDGTLLHDGACTSPFAPSLGAAPDGTYTLVVRAVDAAGNLSDPATSMFVLDTADPAAPVVSAPTGPSNDRSWSVSWTGESGTTATCVLRVGSTVVETVSGCLSGHTFTLSGADGTYSVDVSLTDAAGNTSTSGSASYLLDTTVPAPPVVSAPAGPSSSRSWAVTWSGESGTTATCVLRHGSTVVETVAGCLSGHTFTLSGADGTYSVDVTLTDVAGNTSAAGTASYLLDTTAPAAPVVSAPAGPSSDRSWTVTWTGEAGPTATCALRLGTTTVETVSGCLSGHTFTLSGADGTYSVRVTLTDAAGNTSTAGTASYLLDTTAPAAPAVTAAAGPSSDRAWSVAWSGESGTTASCVLRYGGTVVETVAGCLSGHIFTLSGTDGTYSVDVTLTDAAGNTSAADTASYVLDTAAPAAPVLTATAGPSNVRSWTVTWTGESGTAATCVLRYGSTVVQTVSGCLSGHTFALTGADGTYSVSVTLTDAAGNLSSAGTASYLLDTTAPSAPVVSAPTGPSNSRSWTVTWTGESGTTASCVLRHGSTVVETVSGCLSGHTFALDGPDGTYGVDVTLTDAAGNTSAAGTAEYELDTTPPAVPVFTSEPGTSNSRTPTWEFSSDAGATLLCRLTGPQGVLMDGVCSSPLTQNLSSRPDGLYVLEVRARDAVGNVSDPATSTYVLDTVAPTTPTVVSAPPSPSADRTPTWELSGDADATLLCRLTAPDGSLVHDGACATTFPPELTGLADGTYTLEVRAVDTAGNVSAAVTSTYVLDTTAPVAPVVTAPAGPSSERSWTVSWTGEPGTTATCRLRLGTTLVETVSGCLSGHTFTLSGADGTYTVLVTLTDAAGNTSSAGTASYLLDTTAPVAPAVSAPTGPSNQRSWTVTWTGESGTTATCVLRYGSTVVETVSGCLSGHTFTLDGPDGTYGVDVTLTDPAGNTSTAGTASYLLDTTASDAPVVSAPAGPSNVRTWTVTWTGETGTTATCVLRLGTTIVETVSGCLSGHTFTLAGADGTYSVTVTLTDSGGNTSAPGTATYELDTTAPVAPVVTAPAGPSSGRSWTVTWTGEAGTSATCELRLGTNLVETVTGCLSGHTFTLSGADGTYSASVTLTDPAGNTSSAGTTSYVLDTTAPVAPVLSAPTGPSNSRSWTVTWTGEAGTTATCVLRYGATVLETVAGCASGHTFALEGADGTYGVDVTLTDVAGNTSDTATASYLLDTTAPVAPVVSAPTGPSNSRSWAITWTGEAGTTATCVLRLGTTVVETVSGCLSGHTFTLSGADGTYSVDVRLTDTAGNTGAARTVSYLLDTTAPSTPVLTALPTTPSPSRTPSWSFTGETGGVFLCRLTGPGGVVVFTGTCTSPWTADLAGRADGTYTFEVRVRDAAGNVSSAVTSSYVLDTTAPTAPVLTAPATPGNDRTPTWGISAEGSPECRLTGPGGVLVHGFTACAGSYTADLSALADGTYTLEVRTRDAAGNLSPTSSSSYLLDTTAPPAPLATAPASPSSSPSVTWTVTSTESGTTARCRVLRDGTLVRDWATCTASTTGSPYSMDLTGLPDGTYRLEVRLIDAAGNAGPVTGAGYVYDTTAPAAVTITAPASPGNTRSPTWSFATEPGARLECRVGDSGAFTACGNDLVLDLAGAPDGEYAIWVRSIDLAGNVGVATRSAYVLDTRAPAAPVLTAPAGPSSDVQPTWTWTGEAGATSRCTLTRDGVLVSSGSCSTPWSPLLGADGTYVLTVRLVDAAGNVSAPTSASYVLDTTAPAAPGVAGPSSPNSLTEPLFSFTAEAGAVTECRMSYGATADAVSPISGWAVCNSPTSWMTTDPGHYAFEVRAIDAAGNVSPVAAYAYEYDPAAPAGLLDLGVPASPSTDRSPTWTFTAGEGSTMSCRLVDPDESVLEEVVCDGSFTPSTPLARDGVYRLTITVTDSVGNVGVNEVLYELDTTGPTAPVVQPDGV